MDCIGLFIMKTEKWKQIRCRNCIWKIPLVERCSYVCYTKFQVIAGAPEQ